GPVFARRCVIRRSFGMTKSLSSCLAPRENRLRRGRDETSTAPGYTALAGLITTRRQAPDNPVSSLRATGDHELAVSFSLQHRTWREIWFRGLPGVTKN
ncbi:hypothetical protein, partial [Stutzerimonas nitrititolerans]|uniref:hypothetical protein n=1 Tax=Stutzerimonas nitrititolerans TaxID=2482751 RepID=UPI0028B1BFD5